MALEAEYREKIVGIISTLQPRAKIYLYGSRAKEAEVKGSDVDLAIDTGEKLKPRNMLEIHDVLENTHIPYSCDVVDLQNISESFKNAILKDAVLWKE